MVQVKCVRRFVSSTKSKIEMETKDENIKKEKSGESDNSNTPSTSASVDNNGIDNDRMVVVMHLAPWHEVVKDDYGFAGRHDDCYLVLDIQAMYADGIAS